MPGRSQPLILGIGNVLLSDDGVGIHIVEALDVLKRDGAIQDDFRTRDGGTIGLSLLSELNGDDDLIVVDAMEMGAAPGTVRVFHDADMDRQLTGIKRTAHEVALGDLMMAATLAGCAPRRRALVGVQPETTTWGLTPTAAVDPAIATACEEVIRILGEWRDGR